MTTIVGTSNSGFSTACKGDRRSCIRAQIRHWVRQGLLRCGSFVVSRPRAPDPATCVQQSENQQMQTPFVKSFRFPRHQQLDLSASERRRDDGRFFETHHSRMRAACPALSYALAVSVKESVDGANGCVCSCRLQTFLAHAADCGVQFVLRWVFGTNAHRQPFECVRIPAHGCWADVVKILSIPDKLLCRALRLGSIILHQAKSPRRAT
jgi:hypothetical protein